MIRWTVFKQDSPKKKHQLVGSVYASDAEAALLQARTVFARRPKVVSLWVTPVTEVTIRTRAELEAQAPVATDDADEAWHVFRKTGQRRAMTFVDYVGDVMADSADSALAHALTTFSDDKETWVWTVVPANAVARSEDDDIESWFSPASQKVYKQQSAYGFVGGNRARKGSKDDVQ